MKPFFLFLLLFAGLQLSSSAQVNHNDDDDLRDALPGRETITLTGQYSGKRGVMTKISCYGFNIGELRSTADQSLLAVICFDKLPGGSDLNIDCEEQVTVTGYYETKHNEGSGSCQAGSLQIFYVETWKCVK